MNNVTNSSIPTSRTQSTVNQDAIFCLLMKTVASTMAQEHDKNRFTECYGFGTHQCRKFFFQINKNFWRKIDQKFFARFCYKNFYRLKKFFTTRGNRTHDPEVNRFSNDFHHAPAPLSPRPFSSVNKKIAFWPIVHHVIKKNNKYNRCKKLVSFY